MNNKSWLLDQSPHGPHLPLDDHHSWSKLILQHGSLRSSILQYLGPIGAKRKWAYVNGASFATGLGCSPSSSDNSKVSSTMVSTVSSARDTTDEESSPDLGINFELHLGRDDKFVQTNPSVNTIKVTDIRPNVDLELCLSTRPSQSVITCTAVSDQHQHKRSSSTKNCQYPGCVKGARGASGLCIAHGGGKRCQIAGCHKGAEGRTMYCKAHGGGRRCQHLGGCTKSAEGHTDHCIAHGGGLRCSHEGCPRAARGKSGLCIRHGGGKRCQKENCTKSAESHSGLCISHGGGRRCQFPECTKGAQGSTMFCKAHGGGKRCMVLGCTKGAEGSTAFCKGHGGGKRCSFQEGGACTKSVHGGTLFCVAHGGGKRCVVLDCTKSARGRTDYCVRHGGGKRCKYEGCGKSAQGSTDFCKAHKGGMWGFGNMIIDEDALPKIDNDWMSSIKWSTKDVTGSPEGRVHGGCLLYMLSGGVGAEGQSQSKTELDRAEYGTVCSAMMLGWM